MGTLFNDLPRWIVITVWILANIGLFVYGYVRFSSGQDYYYLRLLVGNGLPWARASAAALNLNCMLILLPVCRNLISFLRGSCKRCCKRSLRRQLDKHITFHKYLGWAIIFHTAIHIGAHVFNLERLLEAWDRPDTSLRNISFALSSLPTGPNDTFINFVRTLPAATDSTREMCKTLAGLTGVVITLALILMASSSTEMIRRSYFEVFWYTHHLFIIFFLGLVIHGAQMIVRQQTNIDVHNPELCQHKFDRWGKDPDCAVPQFAGSFPQTWMWVVGPFVIYLLERIIRFVHSSQKVVITKVIKHPSNTYELQMKKRGFKMGSGQYINIQCMSLSRFEWHPFTLTSAPEDDYFSVHIRRVGDWTEGLAKKCHVDEGQFKEAWKLPKIAVDGPFGTATEDVLSYQVDVFIAAGIGVTPFASVLKHIWYKHNAPESASNMKLKKVYFYWICPDTNAFEWFRDLLQLFDMQMTESGDTSFLDYNIYLTRGWDSNQATNIVLNEEEGRDAITGLQQKTHYGRPQWEKIFSNMATAHPGTKVGVFFCGPKEMSKVLHKTCNQHSNSDMTDPNRVHFTYNKENF